MGFANHSLYFSESQLRHANTGIPPRFSLSETRDAEYVALYVGDTEVAAEFRKSDSNGASTGK